MTFKIPLGVVKATRAENMEALLEWQLSTSDVAALLGSSTQAVDKWATTGGRGGWVLQSRVFSPSKRPRRAFRLDDVRRFARLTGRTLDTLGMYNAMIEHTPEKGEPHV